MGYAFGQIVRKEVYLIKECVAEVHCVVGIEDLKEGAVDKY